MGLPSGPIAGLHFHVFKVWTIDSFKPNPGDSRIRTFSILPSTETTASIRTDPINLAFIASTVMHDDSVGRVAVQLDGRQVTLGNPLLVPDASNGHYFRECFERMALTILVFLRQRIGRQVDCIERRRQDVQRLKSDIDLGRPTEWALTRCPRPLHHFLLSLFCFRA